LVRATVFSVRWSGAASGAGFEESFGSGRRGRRGVAHPGTELCRLDDVDRLPLSDLHKGLTHRHCRSCSPTSSGSTTGGYHRRRLIFRNVAPAMRSDVRDWIAPQRGKRMNASGGYIRCSRISGSRMSLVGGKPLRWANFIRRWRPWRQGERLALTAGAYRDALTQAGAWNELRKLATGLDKRGYRISPGVPPPCVPSSIGHRSGSAAPR